LGRCGSYLSEIYSQSDPHQTKTGHPVRVIEYTLAGHDTVYRLRTTILDPQVAPADDLAALYAERWNSSPLWTKSRPARAGSVDPR
jgi:hypothetical protein